eukprot:scaffold185244_cov13-Tisochrysis_lutea.AAC.1
MGEGNLESGSRAHLLHTLIGRHCPQNNMPIWYSEWLHCPLHIRFKDGLGGRYLGRNGHLTGREWVLKVALLAPDARQSEKTSFPS